MDKRSLDLINFDYLFVDFRAEPELGSKNYFDQIMRYYELPYESKGFLLTDRGKPYVEGRSLNFSISHSGSVICLGLTLDKSIGVDCEKTLEFDDFLSVASRFFAKKEIDYIKQASTPLKSFYTIWCSKEAILKYYGVGLGIPLNSFETLYSKEITSLNNLEVPPRRKYVGELFGSYKIAVYSMKPIVIIKGEFNEKSGKG